jgi:hypothetical protein
VEAVTAVMDTPSVMAESKVDESFITVILILFFQHDGTRVQKVAFAAFKVQKERQKLPELFEWVFTPLWK